jgi:hypothetical protein
VTLLHALDPVPVTELGKADTRSVTGTGSVAPAIARPRTCAELPLFACRDARRYSFKV